MFGIHGREIVVLARPKNCFRKHGQNRVGRSDFFFFWQWC